MSADALVQLYSRSVGRNAKLLLNVPPTRHGLLPETDTARLAAFHERLRDAFARDAAAGRRVEWRRTGGRTATAEIDLGRSVDARFVRLEEPIEREDHQPGDQHGDHCRGDPLGHLGGPDAASEIPELIRERRRNFQTRRGIYATHHRLP